MTFKYDAQISMLMRFILGTLLLLTLHAALGCGDDATGTGGSGGGSARTEDWAVQTVVQTPDGRTSFVQLVDSPGTEPLDLALAREVPGNGRLYLLDGVAYLGEPEGLSVVRTRPGAVALEDDSERLSFAAVGLTFLPSFAVLTSDDEAFLLDAPGGVGYGWDPTEMVLGRQIDLSAVRKDGFEPTIETAVVRDGLIFFVVQQVNTFGVQAFEGLQMGIIDIDSGELNDVIEDFRCIGTRSQISLAEDGTIYVPADNYGATQSLGPDAPPTCILRVLPGQTGLDPDWQIDLPDLLGGRQGSSMIYVGDGRAYVSAIYDDQITISLEDDPVGYFNQPASRWWFIDLDAEIGAEVAGMPFHSLGGANGTVSDGRVFLFSPTNRFEGTTQVFEPDLSNPSAEPAMIYETNGAIPVMGRLND
ncbi:MAG: hypothetical protein AAF500_20845 [Myxococcota bacterium]